MSESSKRHSKFLSLIFILKCLSKASVIRIFSFNCIKSDFAIKDLRIYVDARLDETVSCLILRHNFIAKNLTFLP